MTVPLNAVLSLVGMVAAIPVLPGGALSAPLSEKEYSQLECSKIQAACGLTDAKRDTNLPELSTRMLEEERTTAHVKALLEDTFSPDDRFLLTAVHLGIMVEMEKDFKELNFDYNNDLSYNSSHRGLSPFTVIGIDDDGKQMHMPC